MGGECVIVSLKYAPGLLKEFHLVGRKLAEWGCPVRYLAAEGYRALLTETDVRTEQWHFWQGGQTPAALARETVLGYRRQRARIEQILADRPADFICCYNTHPLNDTVLQVARAVRPESVRALMLHEPGKPPHAEYGWRQRCLFGLVQWMQRRALAVASDVLLPSRVARERFEQAAIRFSGRVHECRLLLEEIPTDPEPRRYFSMVGRFNASKPLDGFITLINESARQRRGQAFQIVTASPIGRWTAALTPAGRACTRIVNPPILSDRAIAQALRRSVAVLCLHGNVTQSGVVPMAYMQGTPVIARDEPGLGQHVIHGQTGWRVADWRNCTALLQAMAAVERDGPSLSGQARQYYEAQFDASNFQRYYRWLKEELAR